MQVGYVDRDVDAILQRRTLRLSNEFQIQESLANTSLSCATAALISKLLTSKGSRRIVLTPNSLILFGRVQPLKNC